MGVNKINALIRVYGIVRARYVFGGRNNRGITHMASQVELPVKILLQNRPRVTVLINHLRILTTHNHHEQRKRSLHGGLG